MKKNVILSALLIFSVTAIAWSKDIWYCPMHTYYITDHPGNCPICGMTLVKKQEKQASGAKVPGYAPLDLSPQKQQLAGIRTALVVKKPVVKTIRAPGHYEAAGVSAQIFETDLPFVKVGQTATIEIPAYRQKFEGAVRSIETSVDETTRTIPVRIWLKNTNLKKFKSHVLANIEFPVAMGDNIIVPRDAVMDTGLRKIVFVQAKDSAFEPREVETGSETDDGLEIKSGLSEGERIAVSGNFLLDSESRVQAGLGGK